MKKRAGVANLGAEELAQTDLKVLTRARTRAAAELLFSQANVAKAKEQRLLGSLFHQTQGAETESPMLAKTAAVRSFRKLAYVFGSSSPNVMHSAAPEKHRMSQYKGYVNRKASEKPTSWRKSIGIGAGVGAIPGALLGAHEGRRSGRTGMGAGIGAAAGAVIGAATGALMNLQDRAEISHTKGVKRSGRYGDAMVHEVNQQHAAHEAHREMQSERRHQELLDAMEKRSTAAIDEFFEKVSSANLSDAQRRYPELLKVSAAPGVGTRPSPNLSKRKTTDTTGPSPTQSSLSGGAA